MSDTEQPANSLIGHLIELRSRLLRVVIAILVVPNAPFSESSPPHRRRIHHPTLLLLLLLLLHQLHLLLHALRGNKGVKCGATV